VKRTKVNQQTTSVYKEKILENSVTKLMNVIKTPNYFGQQGDQGGFDLPRFQKSLLASLCQREEFQNGTPRNIQ
jgi:hypothetical protein